MNPDQAPWRDSVGPGWWSICQRINDKLTEIDPEYTIVQIKEKFGGLRYYFDWSDTATPEDIETMNKVVRRGEMNAEATCEECGSLGTADRPDGGYWIQTLCDECRKPREARDE